MNISNTVGTNEFVPKMPSLVRELYKAVLKRVKLAITILVKLALAAWVMFLCAGVIVSIFGANLQQQKFASTNKMDVNDYLLRSCQLKSINAKIGSRDNKLTPDAAQCLGSKIQSYFK